MEQKKLLVTGSSAFDDPQLLEKVLDKELEDPKYLGFEVVLVTRETPDNAQIDQYVREYARVNGYQCQVETMTDKDPAYLHSFNSKLADGVDSARLFTTGEDSIINDLYQQCKKKYWMPVWLHPFSPKSPGLKTLVQNPFTSKKEKKLTKQKVDKLKDKTVKPVSIPKVKEAYRAQMSFKEFNRAVLFPTLLAYAGYAIDKQKKGKWAEFYQLDSTGRKLPGTTVRVNNFKNVAYEGTDNKSLSVYDFIEKHSHLFREYSDAMSASKSQREFVPILVNKVCSHILNMPEGLRPGFKEQRELSEYANKPQIEFNPSDYEKHTLNPYDPMSVARFQPFLAHRRISMDTQTAFANSLMLVRGHKLGGQGRGIERLAFQILHPSQQEIRLVGFDLRGTEKYPYKRAAAGSSKNGLWIGSPSYKNGKRLEDVIKEAKIVVWTEAGMDCLSYYQMHKERLERTKEQLTLQKTEIEKKVAKLENMYESGVMDYLKPMIENSKVELQSLNGQISAQDSKLRSLDAAVYVATNGVLTRNHVVNMREAAPNALHVIGFDSDHAGKCFGVNFVMESLNVAQNDVMATRKATIDFDKDTFHEMMAKLQIDPRAANVVREFPPDYPHCKDWNDCLKYEYNLAHGITVEQKSEKTESVKQSSDVTQQTKEEPSIDKEISDEEKTEEKEEKDKQEEQQEEEDLDQEEDQDQEEKHSLKP